MPLSSFTNTQVAYAEEDISLPTDTVLLEEVTPPTFQCSDNSDNDADLLVDSADPGCHSDGNVNNPSSYDSNDNNESTDPLPVCSDGLDNDHDDLIDSADPNCHTDSNANNSDSYNSDGNNEASNTLPHDNNENKSSSRKRSHSGGKPITGAVLGEKTSCGIYVDKFLKKGSKTNDPSAVAKVQQFLNDFTNAGLAVDQKFGPKTEAALKAFQLAHKDKILTPWNLTIPTGLFYLTTQTEVNNVMCPALSLPIPSNLIPFGANPVTPKA